MARGGNPFYYQGDEALGASLGQSLGRALFGDPELAAQQAERQAKLDYYGAQSEEARAHAGLYGKQGEGVGIQNAASLNLPALIASLVQGPQFQGTGINPNAPVPGADPLAALPEAPAAADPMEAMRVGMPAVIAALAQMKGEGVDMGDTVGSLAAFLGNDEFARRGMVAQGQTPGKEFALTADRADAIAAQGHDADYRKSTDVASINHATDIPVANIKAGADRDVATIKGVTDRDVADIKETGKFDIGAAATFGGQFGTVTSTVRTAKHNKDVGGVGNSFHLATRGGRAVDIARKPGVSHAQVVAGYRAQGYTILEDLDEGDHSHVALSGGPKKATKAAAPKQVSAASLKMLDAEVDGQTKARGMSLTSGARSNIRAAASREFQASGNAVGAVKTILDRVASRGPQAKANAEGKPVRIANDADFDRLPKGALFIGPDGKTRKKV